MKRDTPQIGREYTNTLTTPLKTTTTKCLEVIYNRTRYYHSFETVKFLFYIIVAFVWFCFGLYYCYCYCYYYYHYMSMLIVQLDEGRSNEFWYVI
jgi:hypothetical protein